MTDVDGRLAVVEHQVAEVLERVKVIEDAVLKLRLHEARNEWIEKVLWLGIGVLVPMGLAVAATVARFAVTTARLP